MDQQNKYNELDFLWNACTQKEIDPSSIIEKTQQKIRLDKKKKSIFIWRTISAAASIALLISLSIYLFKPERSAETDLQAVIERLDDSITGENVTLITAQNQLTVEENSMIKYSSEGEIAVNSDIIKKDNNKEKEDSREVFDQLIVPKGKRARMQLSDGTLLWVNSQSKVVYPRIFKGDIRKIYVQGEAYLEVAHDKSHPFIVNSNDFDLTVLGTKFNIASYKSLEFSNIVLVEGSVEVKDKRNKTVKLQPNDLLSIKEGAIFLQKKVDTAEYTSWIDGLLLLKGEKLSVITGKLNIYFGVNIYCDPLIADKKVYGKLDLKEDLSEILTCLQTTIPMKIQENNNKIYMYKD